MPPPDRVFGDRRTRPERRIPALRDSPRQQRRSLASENTRARILDAARRVFAERGFAATSMSLLARETGVTQSLIHHHFGSKRDLWNHLKVVYGDEYQRRAGPLDVTGDDPIASWTEHFFRFLEANAELVRLIAWAGLDADDELPDRMIEVTRSVDALFRKQQREGRIRADVDPVHAHIMISLCVTGWLQSRPIACALSGLDPDDPGLDERFLADLVTIFGAGLAATQRSTDDSTNATGDET